MNKPFKPHLAIDAKVDTLEFPLQCQYGRSFFLPLSSEAAPRPFQRRQVKVKMQWGARLSLKS